MKRLCQVLTGPLSTRWGCASPQTSFSEPDRLGVRPGDRQRKPGCFQKVLEEIALHSKGYAYPRTLVLSSPYKTVNIAWQFETKDGQFKLVPISKSRTDSSNWHQSQNPGRTVQIGTNLKIQDGQFKLAPISKSRTESSNWYQAKNSGRTVQTGTDLKISVA